MNKKYLISSVSAMVLLLANPVFAEETTPDLSSKPITTPTLDYLGKTSAYEITKGTESDYGFINLVTDSEGKITKEYYKINLTGPKSVTWSADGNHEISLNLPNSETPTTYKYSINSDAALGTKIDNDLTQDKVDGKLFANIQNTGGNGGGAIYTDIADKNVNITSDFIGNSIVGSSVYGGAINFDQQLGSITGNFIGNYAQGVTAQGGAIYNNDGEINSINGDFIGNYAVATGDKSYAEGGAIYHYDYAETGSITGDFIGNYVQTNGSESVAQGGAIFNAEEEAIIGSITGDFIGNYALSTSDYSTAAGGAIVNQVYNDGTKIGSITGNFIGNYAQGSEYTSGGAILNEHGEIGSITGDFIGNYAKAESDSAGGGAIDNSGTINSINGDFIGNYAQGSSIEGGGAIDNSGTIGSITGNFIGNYALGSQYAEGGAMYLGGIIGSITGDFIGNYAKAEDGAGGGAFLSYDAEIGDITGNFIGNYAEAETGYAEGGAIVIYDSSAPISIVNSNFIGNYVSGNKYSLGGALDLEVDATITANDGKTSEFTGNYVVADGEKTENAIYVEYDTTTLTLNAEDNGKILFNDEIAGDEGYAIALTGDSTGTIDFNNDIRNANISLENTNVNLSDVAYLNNNNALTISSGKFNVTQFGVDDVLTANSIAVNGGVLNIASADVDFETEKMGQLENVTVADEGKINVDNFVILNPGTEEKEVINVAFGDENTQSAIETTVTETVAPIYKYSVAYDAETGEFVFTRGDLVVPDEPEPTPGGDDDNNDGDNKPSVPATPIVRPAGYKAFNPGVFANDVAAMAGLNVQGDIAKRVFDMDTNREYCYGRVWATPYYSDDTLNMSGFYDVDSTNYGLIAGVDTRTFGNYDGWNSVYTLFGAYNDGENKYQGVKVDTKSWLVGLKASVFNGGFYGDALINYAWHDSDQTTAFGKDSVDTEGYGAALKAGYKFDFNKVNVDTSLMLSWQQVEGKDFTSKSGARFDTDDYSRLSLVPQIKVGYSLENIRPYALARYNFALSEDGSTTVNNSLALPEIESKDYVEYGLGVETTTSFPHSGYAHVLRHDGGREGWSVTAGYRYNF